MVRRAGLAAGALLAAMACGGPQQSGRDMSSNQVAAELANIRIAPGLWEIRSEVAGVSAPNLPREVMIRMIGPRPTARNCITAAQAARPDANFLAVRAGSDCRYRDFSMRGGRLSGEMTCRGGGLPGATTTRMTGDYGPHRYSLRMEMRSPMPGGVTMILDIRAAGRRIGECPGGGP